MAVEIEKFNRMLGQIAEKVNAIDDEQYAELNDGMAIDFDEHFAYQNTKSEALVSGLISQDVAQVVYASLGEVHTVGNGGWATGTTLPMKALITQLMGELLRLKLKARGVNVS